MASRWYPLFLEALLARSANSDLHDALIATPGREPRLVLEVGDESVVA